MTGTILLTNPEMLKGTMSPKANQCTWPPRDHNGLIKEPHALRLPLGQVCCIVHRVPLLAPIVRCMRCLLLRRGVDCMHHLWRRLWPVVLPEAHGSAALCILLAAALLCDACAERQHPLRSQDCVAPKTVLF